MQCEKRFPLERKEGTSRPSVLLSSRPFNYDDTLPLAHPTAPPPPFPRAPPLGHDLARIDGPMDGDAPRPIG